jgi:hypothetical protein
MMMLCRSFLLAERSRYLTIMMEDLSKGEHRGVRCHLFKKEGSAFMKKIWRSFLIPGFFLSAMGSFAEDLKDAHQFLRNQGLSCKEFLKNADPSKGYRGLPPGKVASYGKALLENPSKRHATYKERQELFPAIGRFLKGLPSEDLCFIEKISETDKKKIAHWKLLNAMSGVVYDARLTGNNAKLEMALGNGTRCLDLLGLKQQQFKDLEKISLLGKELQALKTRDDFPGRVPVISTYDHNVRLISILLDLPLTGKTHESFLRNLPVPVQKKLEGKEYDVVYLAQEMPARGIGDISIRAYRHVFSEEEYSILNTAGWSRMYDIGVDVWDDKGTVLLTENTMSVHCHDGLDSPDNGHLGFDGKRVSGENFKEGVYYSYVVPGPGCLQRPLLTIHHVTGKDSVGVEFEKKYPGISFALPKNLYEFYVSGHKNLVTRRIFQERDSLLNPLDRLLSVF